MVDLAVQILAMAVLMAFSAFFSASEAALFYLRDSDRKSLAEGNAWQRTAADLLADPDRLLSAILFWNLVINIAFFALASIVGLRLEQQDTWGPSGAVIFGLGSLLSLIFFSEMLPKSLAVLSPRLLSAVLGPPLSLAVRFVDPVMPLLRGVNELSRRLIWPDFEPEPYLAVDDLERAIQLSTDHANLVEQEEAVLRNLISLTELRADELMRPRTQLSVYSAPVALADLDGETPEGGYLLLQEHDSEEIAAAVPLLRLTEVISPEHLERQAEPVLFVPWCTPAARVLEELTTRGRSLAAVVNEHGETIGVLSREDLFNSVFAPAPSRTQRTMARRPIQPLGEDRYLVTGMTSVSRLARYFSLELPPTRNITVRGVVQEMLQKFPVEGETCEWGPFRFRIVTADRRGHLMLVELEPLAPKESA